MLPQVTEQPVFFGRRNHLLAEDYKAIVSRDDNYLYSIVSSKYKLIQHNEIVSGIDEILWEMPEYGNVEKIVELSNSGGKLRASFRFPEVEIDVGGDKINPQIVVYNSYDTSISLRIDFGAFKLICSNGLTIGEKVFHYNKKHYDSVNYKFVIQGLKSSLENFSEQKRIWETWVNKTIEMTEAQSIVNKLELGKKENEELLNEVEKQSSVTLLPWDMNQFITKWILFNLITQFITHKVKSIQRKFNLENKLRRMF